MSLLQNSNAISAGGYDVNNSLRFRSSASAYLSRTPTVAGNRTTWTWSAWVKRGKIDSGASQYFLFSAYTASTDAGYTAIYLSGDQLNLTGHTTFYRKTTQLFRDPSAWYHIVVVWDSSQGTASNRIKIYVNGSQVTAFATSNDPSSSQTSGVSSTGVHAIGANSNTLGVSNFDGYMTNINFIDGQALTPSSFGETDTTTGVWQPKAYTGTYGTNGFYLKFSDIATTSGSNAGLGKDFSGNSNYWTTNNISVTSGVTYDAMTDSPTLTSSTVANYAVLNRIYTNTQGVGTLSNANLRFTFTNLSTETMVGTFGASTGKWYWEFIASANPVFVGIRQVNTTDRFSNSILWGGSSISATGDKWVNGTSSAYAGASWTTGDVIGVAVDMDGGTVTFYKNNTSQGSINLSLATITDFVPAFNNGASTAFAGDVNFGQRPFTYTPPTGYVALNTFNLPTPTILQGNKYMDATLYTGNGATRSITNDGSFKPDLVWIKARSIAYFHRLSDSVRGIGKELYSNDTQAETTNQADGWVSAFNSNGFSILGGGGVNLNANTFVAWQWQAGQGTTSSNTQGSITSTVSVNASAGFSIISYTGNATSGATIGHGLGVAPKMVIVKNRPNTYAWIVYHASTGNTGALFLEQTTAFTVNSVYWNNTSPSSSVITLGNTVSTNGSGAAHIAYAFAEIAGFSKFGSYTGNGSADGPFVFTNFRPKFVLMKRTDTVGSWYMLDSARNLYNVTNSYLNANASAAELSNVDFFDFLSNGFKLRTSNGEGNASGGTYIYAAFAENPFKNALAR